MSAECRTVTVLETAEILGMSRNAIYNAIKRGEIPTVKIGRKILVVRTALDKLLSA